MDGLVDHEDIGFASFRFCDGDGVANLFAKQVLDSELEQVACSDAIVDAQGEKQKISRLRCQQLLDAGNVIKASDRFDGNFAALGWTIGGDGSDHGCAPEY